MAFRPATCPSCNESIQVPVDREQVKCMFCGQDVVVKQALARAEGPNVANIMRLARSAEAAGNNAEAEKYFTQVLETDVNNTEAWLGKAKAAGWQSTLKDFRLNEMLIASKQAIMSAPPEEQATVAATAALEVGFVTIALWNIAADHYNQFYNPEYNKHEMQQELVNWATQCFSAIENAISMAQEVGATDGPYLIYFKIAQGFFSFKVSPTTQARVTAKLPEYLEGARKVDPSVTIPAVPSSSPFDCFVATAVYGTPFHPDLDLLRSFRDRRLTRTISGRALIAAYYRVGPALALIVRLVPGLRGACRFFILGPLVSALQRTRHTHLK
jgi:hypothetical protein